MMQVISILFGAGLTVATCGAAGWVMVRPAPWLIRYCAGAAYVSLGLCLLCAYRQATPVVFLVVAATVFLGVLLNQPKWPTLPRITTPRNIWAWLPVIIGVPFALLYFVNAMAPEISPDGSGYHLGVVLRYLAHSGFYKLTTNMYANLTQGCEMLFLFAFGRHSAAALVHLSFLFALAMGLVSYGNRFAMPRAGVIAALIVLVSPVVGVDAAAAYVDAALAATLFALFYALQLWDADGQPARLLIIAGILAGFAFAIKYTGFVAVLYAAGFVAWRCHRLTRSLAILLVPATAMIAPWLIKNQIIVQNPVSPFFNRVFPNPYVHIALEDAYVNAMKHYNGATLGWSTPVEVTVRGGTLQGTLGPILLLAPIALLGLRRSQSRRVLAAAVVFGLPYLENIGTRFLIPCLAFIALAMAIVLADWPAVAIVLVVINAIACWPAVLKQYCAPYNWRLDRLPVAAALRIEPEDRFLDQYAGDWRIARIIQEHVPASGAVYTALPIREAYTDRTILLNYAAALNNTAEELLATPLRAELQPSVQLRFRFPAQELRAVRIEQVGADSPLSWSIAEIQSFDGERANAAGGATADPNPWDAASSSDGVLATRWKSWQPTRPGMYVQADLRAPATADRIVARCSPDTPNLDFRADGQLRSGEWRRLEGSPEITRGLAVSDLRRPVIVELKRRGITHILIHKDEPSAPDFHRYTTAWGITAVAVTGPATLYRLD